VRLSFHSVFRPLFSALLFISPESTNAPINNASIIRAIVDRRAPADPRLDKRSPSPPLFAVIMILARCAGVASAHARCPKHRRPEFSFIRWSTNRIMET